MRQMSLCLAAALAASALLGCSRNTGRPETATRSEPPASRQSPNAASTGHDHVAESAVDRIGISEAKTLLDRGDAVFLDVRQGEAYRVGHIQGAIPMPEAEIASRVRTLPKSKKIITYCS